MKKRKRLKRYLRVTGTSFALILLGIGLDIAIFKSLYHPVTYLYNFLSWLGCLNSTLPHCSTSIVEKSTAKGVPVLGRKGMVVTSQHEASIVGLRILKQGGNAVDAAVAVGYALAVTDPCCGNIGGGGFMVIHRANGKNIALNFREKAPLAAKREMYLDEQGKIISGSTSNGYLAVAVPGTVKGLDQALSRYGTFLRQQAMAPAIKLASDGFVLQSGDVHNLKVGFRRFKAQPNVANIFLKNGEEYQVGDRLIQKDLAQTLKLISRQGPDVFYRGVIADKVVKVSRSNGGILSKADFAQYTVSESTPLRCNYRGYEVLSVPPPGGGTTLCEMLNILEGYPVKQLGLRSRQGLHFMLSSMLHAYADRNTYLGDPAFVKNPVEKLLSKEYAANIRAGIPQRRAIQPKALYADVSTQEGTNTTHYSIQDRYGNAVAVTYTINSYFGAGVIAGNTGFFLNNEMDDFTAKLGRPNNFGLVQGTANLIAPGKRPLSSMSPTIVTKQGKVFVVTGSPGGSTIPTSVLQVITNVIDYGMSITEAVNAPRIHYQGLPNLVVTEPYALRWDVTQELWEMGYRVSPFITWGAAESILMDSETGLLYGASDSRKPTGRAVAY